MYDERQGDGSVRFWAGPTEQFDEAGRKAIKKRILGLFEDVKARYGAIFKGNEEITLSDRALSFMVSELAKYDFGRTDVDAKGAAYQEIVGTNLRGDRGQYFTPRGAVKLMVQNLRVAHTFHGTHECFQRTQVRSFGLNVGLDIRPNGVKYEPA